MTTHIDQPTTEQLTTDHSPATPGTNINQRSSPKRPLPRWVAPVGVVAALCVAGIGVLVNDANNQPEPGPTEPATEIGTSQRMVQQSIDDALREARQTTDGDIEPDPTSADAGSVDDDDDASDAGGSAAPVSVVLTDGGVIPDPPSADAGSMEFVAQNVGGDLHNLVIVRGDNPAALPVDEDGAVIEAALPEGDLIGRIDAVDAGTEESALFDLDAGSYILFCNIVVPSAVPPLPISHFEDGMVTTFTVT